MRPKLQPESRQSPLSFHDLPESERPRERLLTHGAAALTTAELLAIILGTGTKQENVLRLAERLLAHYGSLRALAQATPLEMEAIQGLGRAKIAQVVAALAIGQRLMIAPTEERPIIRTSTDAAQLVLDMGSLAQEHIRIILLDTSRRVIAIPTIYIGTVNASMLRVSEIYREAITRNAPAAILVHNHPSGDPTPSPEDVQLTRTLIDAGRLLDITLLDHLIIGSHEWRSLKEMRLAF